MPILFKRQSIDAEPSDPAGPIPSDPVPSANPEPSQPPTPSEPPKPSQPPKPSDPPRPPTPSHSDKPPTEPSRDPQPSQPPADTPSGAPSAAPSQSTPSSAPQPSQRPGSISDTVVPSTPPRPAIDPNNTPVYYTPTRSQTDFVSEETLSSQQGNKSPSAVGGVNTGAIVGGVIGGIAGICIAIFLVMFVIRRVRKHRDNREFDAGDFRRSAVILDDPVTVPDDGYNHTFNPRPPTMIERKMNTAGIGAGPGSRGPAAQAPNAFNQFQDQYQGQYRDEEPTGYAYQPQETQYGYQNAMRQYGAPQTQAAYGNYYNTHEHVASPPPHHASSPPPVAHTSAPQQRLVPGNGASPNRVSTATTYDDADPYGGI